MFISVNTHLCCNWHYYKPNHIYHSSTVYNQKIVNMQHLTKHYYALCSQEPYFVVTFDDAVRRIIRSCQVHSRDVVDFVPFKVTLQK